MSDVQVRLLTSIGVLCIPVSLLILSALFSKQFEANRRWLRTGLWFFALGYAALSFGILGSRVGLEHELWAYILADAAFVAAPFFIVLSIGLEQLLNRRV